MADFRFFINRQGPRGPQGLQGEKGDPGNTFTVSEGVNTPTEYTLIFDSGDGNQFETDNLRNPIVDRGGTYVRYDRDNVTQYIGEPDMAVIDGTPGIVNLAGKDTVTPNASDAVAYELLEKTVDELNAALEGLDDRLDTDEGDISQAKSDIVGLDNRVTTNEGNIISLQSGKADKSTTYTKTEVNNALAGKANTVHTHTVSQITNAGALASQNTVDYQTQVTNKPIIPTVGNGTITLTQGGVTKGTFTTNQSGNSTINLDAGGTSSFTAGNAINISDNTISVKYDGTTIGLNSSGQLQSLVEEPDMTQYYTKSQVDNLVDEVERQLPGAATSSTLGLVKPDNTTIAVDANGVISANIPTPETVDQTYDASSTHAQSGVAIAGAGFLTSVPTATTSSLGLVQPDGTSITINDGIISAAGSAPSNMVTTDTVQTITAGKNIAYINLQPSGSTGYTNFITPYGSNGRIAISKNASYDTTGTSAGILLDFSNPAAITSVAYGGNSNYINMCTQYSNNTAELRFCNGYKANQVGSSHAGIGKYSDYTYIRNNNTNDKKIYKITTGGTSSSDFSNFFLEKDMLDGTTIQYNGTSGKVEVIGGGGGGSGIEIDEVETPLVIKSVSAKKYSTPVTDDHLQCHYFNSNPPYNATLSETTDYYLEYTLDNGLNCLVSFLQKGNSGVSYKGLGLQAGYYNGSTFVPVFSITDGTGYNNMYYYDCIKGSGDNYSLYTTADQKPNIRVSYDSTAGTLVMGDTANTSNGYSGGSSINVDSGTQAEMAKVNVIRLFAWVGYEAYADGRYIDMSTYTCYNPSRTDYDFHSVVGGSGNTSTLMANFFADSNKQPISGETKQVLTSSISVDHPMPGDISYPVTVGASGAEYTATDTGWFVFAFTAGANNQYVEVQRQLDFNGYGNPFYTNIWRYQAYGSTSNAMVNLIPVKKGDTIKVNYTTTGSNMMIFVPSVS